MDLHDHYRHLTHSLIDGITCEDGKLTIRYADSQHTTSEVPLVGVAAGSVDLEYVTGAANLKLIEALSGSGLLKRNSDDSWTLDSTSYVSGTGLTADKIVLGAGNSAVKTSAVGIATAIDSTTGTASASKNNITNSWIPTNLAVKNYVETATAGLTGALHYVGDATVTVTDGTITVTKTNYTPVIGDVVTSGNKEYVYNGTAWREFGDEGSYALKSITVTGSNGLTGGGALSSNQVISHATLTPTVTEAAENAQATAIAHSGYFTVLTSVTPDDYGHISAYTYTKYKLPASGNVATNVYMNSSLTNSNVTTGTGTANPFINFYEGSTSTIGVKFEGSTVAGKKVSISASPVANKSTTLKFELTDLYAGGTAVTLNGTSAAAGTASFYAPTAAGTAGNILVSTAGVPAWSSATTWSGNAGFLKVNASGVTSVDTTTYLSGNVYEKDVTTSGNKSLTVTTAWVNSTVAVPTTAGTYLVEVHTGTEYGSGIFSVCGGTDVQYDEVALHMSSTAARRLYLKTNDSASVKNFMLSASVADASAKTYVIRYRRVM